MMEDIVCDHILTRVGEPLDAVACQRIVPDLLPAKLEPSPLLAAKLSKVIGGAIGEQDSRIGHVVDLIEDDQVLPALRPVDSGRVPVEGSAVMDMIPRDDVAPIDVFGSRPVAREQ